MIPRESGHGPGRSFRRAGLYYLGAEPGLGSPAVLSDRVAFTHTENLDTDAPWAALRTMARTAAWQKNLKRAAGLGLGGQLCERPVYPLALAWHPEEKPTKEEMIEAGREAQAALGMAEHEALYVAHNDENYAHLHLIICRVNPLTGKVADLGRSKLRLSQWARNYERKRGKIYCQQREANWAKRERGQYTKYREPAAPDKGRITDLYKRSDSGRAFAAALAEEGYALALGRKIMLVDQTGKQYSLFRNVAGVKAKDIRRRLAGVDLPDIRAVRRSLGVAEPPPAPPVPRRPASAVRAPFVRAARQPALPSLPFPLPPQRQVFPAPEDPVP